MPLILKYVRCLETLHGRESVRSLHLHMLPSWIILTLNIKQCSVQLRPCGAWLDVLAKPNYLLPLRYIEISRLEDRYFISAF